MKYVNNTVLGMLLATSGLMGACAQEDGVHGQTQNLDANAPQKVAADGLMAGAAEKPLDLPIGIPQGGYTGRMIPLSLPVDKRETPYTVQFVPSAGVATRVPVKVIWLQQGDDPMVLAKVDLIYSFEGLLFGLEDAISERTGIDVHDRVVLATNHSHGSYGDHSQDPAMYLGGDQFNREVFERLIDEVTDVAEAAYNGMEPAAIGLGFDPDFDPVGVDQIFRDRRSENNELLGVDGQVLGTHKDPRLTLLRVDHTNGTADKNDDSPVAALFHFGMHGTVLGDDTAFLTTDAPGAVELKFQEQFEEKVVVMHMQGGAGDVSPAGIQEDWPRLESLGERAAPKIRNLWDQITTASGSDIQLKMATQSISQDRLDMRITKGGTTNIVYTPYSRFGRADDVVYTDDGEIASPIDEFNAEFGAALCGSDVPVPAIYWGVDSNAYPYQSCAQVDSVIGALSAPIPFLHWDFSWVETPIQSLTQAVVSAAKIENIPIYTSGEGAEVDDFVMGFFPGEPASLYSDTFRHRVEQDFGHKNAICVGYAQDHEGYLLTIEDWLAGGYEASINQWGPIQGEYLLEQTAQLVGSLDGAALPPGAIPDRDWSDTLFDIDPVIPDATMDAGTVPISMPNYLFTRTGRAPNDPQPDNQIQRITGIAQFTFLGGDPAVDMPNITIEYQTPSGDWQSVQKQSGRTLNDQGYEMFVAYTPYPLESDDPRQHYYIVEWQAVQDQPTLNHMAGMPLGFYRFRADGTAVGNDMGVYPYQKSPYTVYSETFEVVESNLLVSATPNGNQLSITAAYPAAEDGWRLLSMSSDWNTPTALAGGTGTTQATVSIRQGATTVFEDTFDVSSSGDQSTLEMDLPGLGAGSYLVVITDEFGNRGSTQIQL